MRSRVTCAAATAALVAAVAAAPACNEREKRNGSIRINEPSHRVVVEAESGKIEPPFEAEAYEGASGGRCLTLAEEWATHKEKNPAYRTLAGVAVSKGELDHGPRGEALVPNGSAEVPFKVARAGEYRFWARVWFNRECADSFYFSIDRPSPVDANGDGEYDENAPYEFSHSTYERWVWWKFGRTLALAEGEHALRIFPREDGIRIDQVAFVESREGPFEDGYVPTGLEKSYPEAGR